MTISKKVLIVGAGPAGLAVARRLADHGCQVVIYEQRKQLAGNCYDEKDEHGVQLHRYGPHYFRTNSEELLSWLSRFTRWIPGRYYVRAQVGNRLIPMPVSLASMTALKNRAFTETMFNQYLDEQRVQFETIENAEQQCLAHMGRELYELLFKNYTYKQWGIEAKELDPSVTARIPLRFNWDERYVDEKYQVTPHSGFTRMFENMADHANIRVEMNSGMDHAALEKERKFFDIVIYTGPLDALFNYRYGRLGYRSLRFEYFHYKTAYAQPCVQINHPNSFDYTRTVEIKHVTGQTHSGTTVCHEYPQAKGDPYYPLLIKSNKERCQQYLDLANTNIHHPHPIFLVGRLAEFRYFNTDQVLIRALALADQLIKSWS